MSAEGNQLTSRTAAHGCRWAYLRVLATSLIWAAHAGCITTGTHLSVEGDASRRFAGAGDPWTDAMPASTAPRPDVSSDERDPEVRVAGYVSPQPTSGIAVAPPHANLTLSVAEVIERTLRQNPALQVRRAEVEAARARWVAAGLLPNPQLVIEEEVETNGSSRHETVAWAMFDVPTGPQRRLRRTAAMTAVEASQARFSREVRGIAIRAAEAAIELQYWQQVVQLDVVRRDLAARIATVQAARFEAGEAAFSDRVIADLARVEAELALRETTSRLALARISLNEAMGDAIFSQPEIRGPLVVGYLPPLSIDEVLSRAREVMPEIHEGRLSLAASHDRWEAERWEAAPTVSAGPRFRDAMSGSSDRIGARLAVEVPVFDRNQGGVFAATAEVDANAARRYELELRAMSDVTATLREAQALDSNLAYFERQVLPLAESAADTLQSGFDDRLVGALPLLELLEQLGRIRGQHLDMQRRQARLRVRLELLLDLRLDNLPKTARFERLPTPDP